MAKLSTPTKKTTTTTGLDLAIAAHRALSQNTRTNNHLVLEAYEQLFTAVWKLPKANFQTEYQTYSDPNRTQANPTSVAKSKSFKRKAALRNERRTHLPTDTFASRLHSRIMNQARAAQA